MNFVDYKNLIESKGIKLFDHEYRISYFEINNMSLTKNISNGSHNIQKGGSKENKVYRKLKKLDNDNFLNVILLSISSNPQYIVNLL
jgi:hypothetical protein